MTTTRLLVTSLGASVVCATTLLSGCGAEEPAPAGTASVDSSAEEPASTTEPVTGDIQATGNIGPTGYRFAATDRAYCQLSLDPLLVVVSGLVDEATGAELVVRYDGAEDATGSISVFGGESEQQWILGESRTPPPARSINDDGTITLTGEFVNEADPDGLTGAGGVTVSC